MQPVLSRQKRSQAGLQRRKRQRQPKVQVQAARRPAAGMTSQPTQCSPAKQAAASPAAQLLRRCSKGTGLQYLWSRQTQVWCGLQPSRGQAACSVRSPA